MQPNTHILPKEDPYTVYDYDVGQERMAIANSKHYKIECDAIFDIVNNPFNANFCNAFYSAKNVEVRPKLKVTYCKNNETICKEVTAITKEKTREFAKNAFDKWQSDTEIVLSSSDTGALYWNVIYHFGSFNAFVNDGVEL